MRYRLRPAELLADQWDGSTPLPGLEDGGGGRWYVTTPTSRVEMQAGWWLCRHPGGTPSCIHVMPPAYFAEFTEEACA